ncbi:tRNA uridine 5-carboxymethylaminomethyl modification enzyme MnmG [Gottschalkia acidurici 9a]|uniref:tRNA uridine 5-carboxymethylaminomethyl modification enzyme MnmG n=1 Tax=Gottschalkia acidurici (strain ATCC 7906 / DSM 604 / BCRC 14475 / CIP 104303 / KCTC 5404 / NCIMB 10678 / 9a) TaxID=1128398 RepID=K0B628_GOTA9|nr:tRNA uridine-5-carboxymethylaminomethyl(34) synthesis enzyme MnmG [Gottschalkia acidurici]AFS79916.1 tRNA uridine 5-carboxymethylaminomethyl modification enzyme MnmG [Gottschalkia acidurici 9a]
MNKGYYDGKYDVIVIGAGHAGCEAALATARMGKKTLILTMSLDAIALLACNPSIGGTGKGHLVKEVDALGGEMGLNTDYTTIQSRMLNTAKGPAVHSLRTQTDKSEYQIRMKNILENQENLDLRQGEVTEILVEDEKVTGVITRMGARYDTSSVIICTGTYLKGRIFVGDLNYEGGPNGLYPSNELSECLKGLGFEMRRFKTGTPARIHRKSVDFSKVIEQPGDEEIIPFSFLTEKIDIEQISCYLTYTNEETHKIIRENLHKSPMYSGDVDSIGPRYCPSIEDKIVRFSDKNRHQVFLEPEGKDTHEMYVQGMSSTLPEEVLVKMMKSVEGLEDVKIMRSAYAIEYDCIDPTELKRTLESMRIENLFFAGQINGTSGYEEAASQGIVAGINAVLKLNGQDPMILDRSEGYIGVLIDDLVTKGTNEPYRMMTSRSEYRLTLRQDNADLRLTEKGYKVGLVTEERYKRYLEKKEAVESELKRLKDFKVNPSREINEIIKELGTSELKTPTTLYDLIKRPELNYDIVEKLDTDRPTLNREARMQVEIQIKYDGYIDKQIQQIEQFKKLESKKLSPDMDYEAVKGIRLEARQKLSAIKPESVGQASRISGVSPADINVLLIYLEQQRRLGK